MGPIPVRQVLLLHLRHYLPTSWKFRQYRCRYRMQLALGQVRVQAETQMNHRR
jgi:hypothetical protein